MAIIEIARIQVRRGQESQTGIPQLDSGELGWAEDTEHLYIGKRIVDGAKDDNNTRILTENDLVTVFSAAFPSGSVASTSSYRYRAELPYPRFRSTSTTIATKLDQNVSMVDFTPIWPPTSDAGFTFADVANKALQDLYINSNNFSNTERVLKIPAGTFVVNDTITLPPKTKLVGEGKGLTNIILTNDSVNLFQTVDKRGNRFGSMSNNQYENPSNIHIEGMTLLYSTMTSSKSLLSLDNVRNATVQSVEFKSLALQTTSTSTVVFSPANWTSSIGSSITLQAGERTSSTNNLLVLGSARFSALSDGGVYFIETIDGSGVHRYAQIKSATLSNNYYRIVTTSSFGNMDFTVSGQAFQLYRYNGAGNGIAIKSQDVGSTNYNSNNIAFSENIRIIDCTFDGVNDCIVATSSTNRITIEDSLFKNSIAGIKLNTGSTATVANGPTNCFITNNKFDTIYQRALYVDSNPNGVPSNVISSYNYFTEVGNDVNQEHVLNDAATDSSIALKAYPIIEFNSMGNTTSNDFFNRREQFGTVPYKNALVKGSTNIQDQLSRSVVAPGKALTTLANFPMTGTEQFIEVKYQMTNSYLSRKGTVSLNIRGSGTSSTSYASVSDTYVYTEEQSPYGLATSSMTADGGSSYDTLYVTPSVGNVDAFNDLVAQNINGGSSIFYLTGSAAFAGLASYVVSFTAVNSSTFAIITQSANPQFNYDPVAYPAEKWSLLIADTPVFTAVPFFDTNYVALACDTNNSSIDTSFNLEFQINSFQQ